MFRWRNRGRMLDRFSGEMNSEKSPRHAAAGEKGKDAGEQAYGNQESAQFDDSNDHHLALRNPLPAEHAEHFLGAVTGEEQTDDQPHNAIKRIREALKRIHDRRLSAGFVPVKNLLLLLRAAGRGR